MDCGGGCSCPMVGETGLGGATTGDDTRHPGHGQHPGGRPSDRGGHLRSSRGHNGRATASAAGVRGTPQRRRKHGNGVAHPCAREMAPTEGPPPPDRAPAQRRTKGGADTNALHIGMWHPTLTACPRCGRHEEVTTCFRCPCQRPGWTRALRQARAPWRLHGGVSLQWGARGVPWSMTCIAAEGEGTQDWVAVLREHVSLLAAVLRVEFRQWADIVRSFAADV